MSRNSGVLRGVILAVLASMVTLTGGLNSPASAVPGNPVIPPAPACVVTPTSENPYGYPAPTCYDPSGSDYDEFVLPSSDMSVNGNMSYAPGKAHSTGGLATLEVVTGHWGDTGFITDASWVMSFNTAVTSSEAGIAYRAEVVSGTCSTSTQKWQVNWYALNVADASARLNRSIHGSVDRLPDDSPIPPGAVDVFLNADRVFDGQEVLLGTEYMYPGTYRFAATVDGVTSGWLSWRLAVPTCGDFRFPELTSGTGGNETRMPVATLKQKTGTFKMKTAVVNRKVDYTTVAKIVMDPKKGKTIIEKVRLKPGMVFRKIYASALGTKFIVKARVRVKQADGRYAMKWKVLKTSTVKRR